MRKLRSFIMMLLLPLFFPVQVLAMTASDYHSIKYHDEFYNSEAALSSNSNCAGGASGGDLDRFIQAIAEQESGGNYLAQSGSGSSDASGRYQYISTTWQGSATQNYPPASAYPTAKAAPGPMQDAVMYIEYAKKFKSFNGDLFKLAVSHFYPAANSDPAALDQIIGSNVITPRQYANQVVAKINAGSGKSIALHYAEAPDFAKYLAAAGITQAAGAAAATDSGCATSDGSAGGNIVQKALSLAWPDNNGHTGPDSATAAYKAAWDGASNMTDCGAFVATVMITSSVDVNYPKVGTVVQKDYVTHHPEKYQIIVNPTNSSQLQPGDILISVGHTLIYTGPNHGYVIVDASLSDHTPMVNTAGSLTWMFQQDGIIVARVIK